METTFRLTILLLLASSWGCDYRRANQALNQARLAEQQARAEAERYARLVAEQETKDALTEDASNSQPRAVAGRIGDETKTPPLAHEDLDGTAWVQTSAEYPAITRQIYRLATHAMKTALDDPKWTAFPQQQAQLESATAALPPAVMIDVDETVLDNSGFQAELVLTNGEYNPDIWNAWVAKRQSRAVPGAKEFIGACRAAGVEIFFLTNREFKVEDSTRKNLEQLGLIPTTAPDTVLSKREKEAWDSNKSPRREFVAQTHRVLLLVGDDLNDFVYAGNKPTDEIRRDVANQYQDWWGHKWFVLPNPSYGGWERSLYEFNDLMPRQKKLRLKRENLWTSEDAEVAEEAKVKKAA